MNARLIAVEGPLKGSLFPLPAGRWSVGRGGTNDLQIRDNAISRDHCVFERSGGHVTVTDSASHNGTFVNGVQVGTRTLAPGDEILIGPSRFLFLLDGGEGDPEPAAVLKTVALRLDDSVYLSRNGPPSDSLPARDVQLLLRLSVLLNSFRALYNSQGRPAQEGLSRHLMPLLMEIIPAHSGAVLGPSMAPGSPYIVLAASEQPPAVEAQVFGQVSNAKVAVFARQELDRPDIIAAPILVRDEVEAVLYLTGLPGEKTFDDRHLELLSAVAGMASVAWENASMLDWLRQENDELREGRTGSHGMVGESAKIRELQAQIVRVAPSNSTVLILGESGTGKELIARAVHRASPRAAGPFVAINCAALTESLLESELFGYERGAFTGAMSQRKGKLEVANGGTVFLDEIGELPLLLQSKLLRVLQERTLERVGGTQSIKLDVRVLAATNRDLAECAKRGEFRQDLFYRLNVVALTSAPLRQRPEDIVPLAEHFTRKLATETGRRIAGISPRARVLLQSYSWPGNVRELENAIERAVVLGVSESILPEDLPENIHEELGPGAATPATLFEEAVDSAKRQAVLRAFEQAGYQHDAAAKLLGLHPNYLHRLIRNLDIKGALKSSARAR